MAAVMSSSATLHACDLADQRGQWLGDPYVIERGAALGVRHPGVFFEETRDQRFARMRDIRYAVSSV
jgi:hypothetical protein